MNAVTSTRAERPAESTKPLGEITASWQIMPDALMVIGWRNEKPAENGFVSIQSPGAARGRFHLISWPHAEAGPNVVYFLAAIQLPPGGTVRGDEAMLLTGQGEPGGVLARLPNRFLDPASFGTEVGRVAISSALAVTRFLLQTFSPAASSGNADIRAMLRAFLDRASSPDGCVEIVGAIDDSCAVLQGWGAPPGPASDVVLVGAGIEISPAHIALFSRPDMRGNATGQLVLVPGPAARSASRVEAVVLLDRRGLRWRPVLPERPVLASAETVEHLRATLPSLQCDTTTKALLHASLRPRFEGRSTLYDSGQPVRLAVDLAVAVAGAGTYLTGWLFDPTGAVADIQLRSTQADAARIDRAWTRIPRQDVAEAFRRDAALPPPPAGQHRHGFAVHVAAVGPAAAGQALFLDVTFRNGDCGFVPLTVETGDQAAVRGKLLASVDLHKSSGSEIIERHLGPFLSNWMTAAPAVPANVASISRGWTTSIVVPLAEAVLPRAILSQFLRDPLSDSEGMVFICSEAWTETAVESLAALAKFYGIAHVTVPASGNLTPASALETAAAITISRRLLLLGPDTIGRSPGWRQALYAALDEADGQACVSPTVVYEDESIRFAGSDMVERLDTAPYVRIKRRLAGMPVSIIKAMDAEATTTISPACCLVARDVLQRRNVAVGMVTTSSAQEISLSLLMKENGAEKMWLPAVQVYAADSVVANAHENTIRVGQLVDGWCLRARLGAGD